MRCAGDRFACGPALHLCTRRCSAKAGTLEHIMLLVALVAGISCSNTVSAPDPPRSAVGRGQSGMLGVWVGTITDETVGKGTATLVLDRELTSSTTIPLVSGRWTFVFPDPRFSGQGLASALTLPENGHFVIAFDRVPTPCPGQPDVMDATLSASFVPAADRLRGRYITLVCMGKGEMDLARR